MTYEEIYVHATEAAQAHRSMHDSAMKLGLNADEHEEEIHMYFHVYREKMAQLIEA